MRRWLCRLRSIEQYMRGVRCARARLGERPAIEQLGVEGIRLDCLTERIAGVPGRAAIEMPADALAGGGRVGVLNHTPARQPRSVTPLSEDRVSFIARRWIPACAGMTTLTSMPLLLFLGD